MNKYFIKLPLIISILLFNNFHINTTAQPILGFWGVSNVMVGDRDVTPVAKWFKINEDGTGQSGNGWTQNATSSWTYNSKTNEYLPVNNNGIKDEFGAFKVRFSDENKTMYWEREEEGMKVVVTLNRITKLPMSTSDSIAGLWGLHRVIDANNEDITSQYDSSNQNYIFIRHDRLYRLRNFNGNMEYGYWHMDGHQPEFTLINFDRSKDYKNYMVSFKNEQLIMQENREKSLTFYFKRINEVP